MKETIMSSESIDNTDNDKKKSSIFVPSVL